MVRPGSANLLSNFQVDVIDLTLNLMVLGRVPNMRYAHPRAQMETAIKTAFEWSRVYHCSAVYVVAVCSPLRFMPDPSMWK